MKIKYSLLVVLNKNSLFLLFSDKRLRIYTFFFNKNWVFLNLKSNFFLFYFYFYCWATMDWEFSIFVIICWNLTLNLRKNSNYNHWTLDSNSLKVSCKHFLHFHLSVWKRLAWKTKMKELDSSRFKWKTHQNM